MTIYEIKQKTAETNPHFFTRKTLKYFHQTLRDFRVYKRSDGKFLITAPMRDYSYKVVGMTEKLFNPITNDLETVK